MKSMVLSFFCLTILGSSAVAADCPETPSAIASSINSGSLDQMFSDFGVDPVSQPVYFVTLDHRKPGTWAAYSWKAKAKMDAGKKLPVSKRVNTVTDGDIKVIAIPRGEDGLPELLIARNERVIFALTHTTPQLYTLSKETTVTPIPNLADIAKILNVFGDFTLAVVGRKSALTSLPAATVASSTPTVPPDEDPKKLEDLKAELASTKARMVGLGSDHDAVVRLLQYAEYDNKTITVPNMTDIATHAGDVSAPFETARKALKTFKDDSFAATHSCKDLGDLAKKAITALASETRDDDLRKIRLEVERSTCNAKGRDNLLKYLTIEPETAVSSTPPAGSLAGAKKRSSPADPAAAAASAVAAAKKAAVEKEKKALDIVRAKLELFSANVDATLAALAVAAEIDAAELVTAKTATTLTRLALAPHSDAVCTYTSSLLFADSPDQIAFDKTGTVKVTIAEAAPFGATYDRRPRATGDRSFRIANPTARRIAVAVGGIYTPLTEPKYKAITNPLNDTQKVIAKVDEEKRGGAVALLAAYRFGQDNDIFRPGIQLGVGFGSSPQIFGGFSGDLSSIIRIGVGITGQQVKDLVTGQSALHYDSSGNPLAGATVVKDDAEIRLKQRFRTGVYISLSVTLDSLSLFKKPAS